MRALAPATFPGRPEVASGDTLLPMPTALVTGATAGIGAAFARRLAQERYDLILVARDQDRLDAVAEGLRAVGSAVEVLAADLGTDAGCGRVEERLAAGGVQLLVNNAGFSTAAQRFDRIDREAEEAMLRVNVRAVMRLCHAALPAMRTTGRGDLVNVSSVAGFFPSAGSPTYAASKAYVTAFSEGLSAMYGPAGIRTIAVCPGFVRTEFHERAGLPTQGVPEKMWLSADEVVSAGLRDLRRGIPVSVPTARYKALVAAERLIPSRAMVALGRRATQRRGH